MQLFKSAHIILNTSASTAFDQTYTQLHKIKFDVYLQCWSKIASNLTENICN